MIPLHVILVLMCFDYTVDNATTFAFFRAINHALREAAVHPTESLRHHWSTLGHSDFLDSNFEYQHSEKAALPVAARVRLRVQQRLAKWTSVHHFDRFLIQTSRS
jgi:hypothetical protein